MYKNSTLTPQSTVCLKSNKNKGSVLCREKEINVVGEHFCRAQDGLIKFRHIHSPLLFYSFSLGTVYTVYVQK